MMSSASNIQNSRLSSFAMMVLAASPLLFYYNIGESKISVLTLLGVIIALGLIINVQFKLKLPKPYLYYWGWCTLQLYFIAGIAGWSDYFPGGILLFIFSLQLLVMIQVFDMEKLYNYMKFLFIIASVLMFVQYAASIIGGENLFFVPYITDNIQGRTYQELLQKHMLVATDTIPRFCSIFIEPSYFGQYAVILLTIELFREKVKDQLFSVFSIFIVIVLLVLRSGVGLVGLSVVAITKVLYLLFKKRSTKYIFMLAVLVPITLVAIQYYLSSDSGVGIYSRMSEFDMNSDKRTSGSTRMYSGWFSFSELSLREKLLGTSRSSADIFDDAFQNMSVLVAKGQGLIGLFILICFYIMECRKQKFLMWALFISLTTIALIEACYLGGLMLITTVIIVASKKQQINNERL